MEIKQEIEKELSEIVAKLFNKSVKVELAINSDSKKGDLSSNLALKMGSILGGPMVCGEKIVEELKKSSLYASFEKIELVQPGFINFWLGTENVSSQIEDLINNLKKVGSTAKSLEERILEFGDPNPFKEPHIGHLRIFAVGESLSRLYEFLGTKMIRANYQGDVGLHVAKAIWGVISLGFDINRSSPSDLGKAYAHGATQYEANELAKAEINEINKKVYSKDPGIMKIWEKGREISLDYFENLYQKMGVNYDKYYFESKTAPLGKEIVDKYQGKVFEKDGGAIIFRGEKYGLHTRVFVTKDGHATYEGKDLALAIIKHKDFPKAASTILTANEQAEYFKVLIKALEQIDKGISNKTNHLSVGFVNLKDGKMSSRTGNVVSAFWLIEETQKRIKKGFKEVSDDVLELIALSAVKWSMLKFSRESDISFSIEESIQIEGNSGPYLLYTYARTQSVLNKKENYTFEAKSLTEMQSIELALARHLCQFLPAVKNAKDAFSPNILTEYLFDLAKNFNAFYEKEKILGSEKEQQKLTLVKATGDVLKKGLYLLGIEAPQKI